MTAFFVDTLISVVRHPKVVQLLLDNRSTEVFGHASAVCDAEGIACAGRFSFRLRLVGHKCRDEMGQSV